MTAGLTNTEVVEIYRAYGHLLLRRCRVILRDQALAEDALQEALVKVMRYGAALRQADAKLRWLCRVADRCCFDVLHRRRGELATGEGEFSADASAPHPALELEQRQAVLRFLHRLGDKERTIAVLAFVDGMSQEAIAAETGWSRQTVNKKLQRIRE